MAERQTSKLDRDRVLAALGTESTVADRLEALSELGFAASQIADAVGVSPEAIRQWRAGGKLRPSTAATLDDLRYAVRTLLEGGVQPDGILPWFTSRRSLQVPRPLDIFAEHAEYVLAAAEARVDNLGHTEAKLLAQAVEVRERTTAGVTSLDGRRAREANRSAARRRKTSTAGAVPTDRGAGGSKTNEKKTADGKPAPDAPASAPKTRRRISRAGKPPAAKED